MGHDYSYGHHFGRTFVQNNYYGCFPQRRPMILGGCCSGYGGGFFSGSFYGGGYYGGNGVAETLFGIGLGLLAYNESQDGGLKGLWGRLGSKNNNYNNGNNGNNGNPNCCDEIGDILARLNRLEGLKNPYQPQIQQKSCRNVIINFSNCPGLQIETKIGGGNENGSDTEIGNGNKGTKETKVTNKVDTH